MGARAEIVLATDLIGQIASNAQIKSVKMRYRKMRRLIDGRRRTVRLAISATVWLHSGARIVLHNPREYWA